MSCTTTKQLFHDSSDSDDADLQINKDYAGKYSNWRRLEEIQKLKTKYGDDPSSSSSESEDDVPVIEKDFLKTLSLLKSKDPEIYDKDKTFFNETNDVPTSTKPKEKKPKPLFMKDYERGQLLKTNGQISDDEDKSKFISTYDEEQKKIKESFKAVLEEDEPDEEDDLFHVRQKNKIDKEKDEADYIQWLKDEKDLVRDNDKKNKDLKFLKKFWNDPNLDPGEKFLRNYLLNKNYQEDDDETDYLPTYDEITNDTTNLSEDEANLEKQAEFEHKYNFRFEEPDSEFIKRYPRTIGDSLRKKDKKRKLKRIEIEERKKREKEQKHEEIKRLKALKRKEIEERISKLKEITGNEQLGFEEFDLNQDFDPSEHDKKMEAMFNEEYYDVGENDKPEFPFDPELDEENWDNWNGPEGSQAPDCEDPNFNMDAEYDPRIEFQKQMIESTQSRKKKKTSKFANAVSKRKPNFDPNSKSFEEYFDEYYKLEYEDIIGDLPVRFKYRKVVPNDFGLTTDEIFKANDKELNRWCSLKKTLQYRTENEEMYDIHAFKRKAENVNKKRRVFCSLFSEPASDTKQKQTATTQENETNRKRKRKTKQVACDEQSVENAEVEEVEHEEYKSVSDVKSSNDMEENIEGTSSNTKSNSLQENDAIPSKKKHKENQNQQASLVENNELTNVTKQDNSNSSPTKKKKRKKKKKLNQTLDSINPEHPRKTNLHQNVNKSKNKAADKRLELSNARLQAYGINPKKFKNRIIFSKKNKGQAN